MTSKQKTNKGDLKKVSGGSSLTTPPSKDPLTKPSKPSGFDTSPVNKPASEGPR